jgi:hypothetical protein
MALARLFWVWATAPSGRTRPWTIERIADETRKYGERMNALLVPLQWAIRD